MEHVLPLSTVDSTVAGKIDVILNGRVFLPGRCAKCVCHHKYQDSADTLAVRQQVDIINL